MFEELRDEDFDEVIESGKFRWRREANDESTTAVMPNESDTTTESLPTAQLTTNAFDEITTSEPPLDGGDDVIYQTTTGSVNDDATTTIVYDGIPFSTSAPISTSVPVYATGDILVTTSGAVDGITTTGSADISTEQQPTTAENIVSTTEKLIVTQSSTDSIQFTTSGAVSTDSVTNPVIGDTTTAEIATVDSTTGKPAFTTGEQDNGKTTAAYISTTEGFSDTRGMTPTSGVTTTRPRTNRLSTESEVIETTVDTDTTSTTTSGVIVTDTTERIIITTTKTLDTTTTTVGDTTTVAGAVDNTTVGSTIAVAETTKVADTTKDADTTTVVDTTTVDGVIVDITTAGEGTTAGAKFTTDSSNNSTTPTLATNAASTVLPDGTTAKAVTTKSADPTTTTAAEDIVPPTEGAIPTTEDNEIPTTAAPTAAPTVGQTTAAPSEPPKKVAVTGAIASNFDFTEELATPGSDAFVAAAATMKADLEKMFSAAGSVSGVDVTVTGFKAAGSRRRRRQSEGKAEAEFEAELEVAADSDAATSGDLSSSILDELAAIDIELDSIPADALENLADSITVEVIIEEITTTFSATTEAEEAATTQAATTEAVTTTQPPTTTVPTTTQPPTETKSAEIFYIVTVCTVFDFSSQAKDSADATSLVDVLKVLKDHTDWPAASTLNDVAIESDFVDESGKACGEVDFTFTGYEEAEATDIINDAFFADIATLLEESLETKIETLASEGDGSVLPNDLELDEDDFSDADILTEDEEPEYDTETVVELEYSDTYEPDEAVECDNPADIDLSTAGLNEVDEETLKCTAAANNDANSVLDEALAGLADSGLDIDVLDSIAGLEEEPLFVQGPDTVTTTAGPTVTGPTTDDVATSESTPDTTTPEATMSTTLTSTLTENLTTPEETTITTEEPTTKPVSSFTLTQLFTNIKYEFTPQFL